MIGQGLGLPPIVGSKVLPPIVGDKALSPTIGDNEGSESTARCLTS